MRRAARILVRVLLWTTVSLAALLLGVLTALQFKPVRDSGREQLLAAVRGSLRGELYFDDLRWPSLERIELSGVSLHDRNGTPVLTLPTAVLQVRLHELLMGRVRVVRVDLHHPYVDLADFGDRAGLLSLFGSDEPKPPEPKKRAGFSPITVLVDQLCIDGGQVALTPDAARELLLQRIDSCLALTVGHKLVIQLDHLRAKLQNRDEPVLELVPRDELPAIAEAVSAEAANTPMRVGVEGKFALGQAMEFDGDVQVRQLGRAALEALGIDASALRAPVQLDVQAHTQGDNIAYQLEVRAKTSRALLRGHYLAQKLVTAHVQSERVALQDLTDSQLDPLSFELDARADLSSAETIELGAELTRARLGTSALPQLELKASRAQDGTLVLSQLTVHQAEAMLSARGRLEPDGRAEARLDVSVPATEELPALRQLSGGLTGALSGNAYVVRDAAGHILADVDLAGRRLQLQENAVDTLALRAHATGELEHPELSARLDLRQLALGSEQIADAQLTVEGGGVRPYTIQARSAGRAVELSAWAEAQHPGWSGGFDLSARIQGEPLRASLEHALFVPESYLRIQALRAEYLGARVHADGRIELGGRPEQSKLRFGATVPELATLTRKFMQTKVPGRIEVVGQVRGDVAKPGVTAHARWMNGPEFNKRPIEVAMYARGDLARARAEVSVLTQAGSARANGKITSRWRKGQPLATALPLAKHDITFTARGLPIEALASSGGKPAPIGVHGLLGGQLEAHGNLRALSVETHWQAELRAARDPNLLHLQLDGRYADSKLELGLVAGDRQGQLLDVDMTHQFDVEAFLASAQPVQQIVDQTRWQARAVFAKRRVRELPLVRGLGLDKRLSPLTIETEIDLRHEPGQEPVGDWKTDLVWTRGEGDASVLEPCSRAANAHANLHGALSGGAFKLIVRAESDDKEAAHIEADLFARLEDMLTGRADRIGPTNASIKLDQLDLSKIPIVCERGQGVMTAQLTGSNLFADMADFKIKWLAERLSWQGSPALDARLEGHSDGDDLRVRSRMRTGGDGELRIDGALPIAFRTKDPLLAVDRERPVALTTHWRQVDVAAVLAYAPGIARSSGRLDGQIDVSGTLQKMQGRGELTLDDLSFTLPRLGQRFSHLHMKAKVDQRALRLSEGRFHDLDGSASIAAQVSLDNPEAWTAELNLNVRNFPVRKSGVMMGRADADVNVAAKVSTERADVDVKLNDVAIQLTTSDMGSVQALDPDPEIQFVDAILLRDEPKPQDDGEQTQTAMAAQINIETPNPLWIRRDDFAIQMTTQIKVALHEGAPDMTGRIDLLRGYISLLGTSFDVKRGKVTFTGGERVDPQLEISAEHDAASGARVQLEVTGFVQAPKLAFSINGQTVTAGEAILAITGRGDPNGGKGAEQQLASAAIGMTTGLLSLGARREFGDWVPMLSIEQGDQTRVRVGFEADKLIPKFMRGFVRGAYVEGIVASGGTTNNQGGTYSSTAGAETNTATGSGVLLELNLPKSLVWAGQYGPGDAWSIDLDWRP